MKKNRCFSKGLHSILALILVLSLVGGTICTSTEVQASEVKTMAAVASLSIYVGDSASVTIYLTSNLSCTLVSDDSSIAAASITGMSTSITSSGITYGRTITVNGYRVGETTINILSGSVSLGTIDVSVVPKTETVSYHVGRTYTTSITSLYSQTYFTDSDAVSTANGSTTKRTTTTSVNGNSTTVTTYTTSVTITFNEAGSFTFSIYGSQTGQMEYITASVSDHDWSIRAVTKEASCIETGVFTYTCSICQKTRTEEIPVDANNHPNTKTVDAVAASCLEDGYTGDVYCEDCGSQISAGEIIPALGHSFIETGVKEATCTDTGTMTYTCTRCGEIRTEDIPIDSQNHSWNEGEVTAEATCTNTGTMTYTCTKCGEIRTETIEKIEHNFENGKCTLCGLVDENYKKDVSEPVISGGGSSSSTGSSSSGSSSISGSSSSSSSSSRSSSGSMVNEQSSGTTVAVGTTTSDSTASYTVTASSSSEKTVTVTGAKKSSVTSVTIPATVTINGSKYKVTAIDDSAFFGCGKLKSVKVGSNVTEIGSNAFYNCTALTKVTGCTAVTSIGSKAFYKCTKLTQVGSRKNTVTLAKIRTIGSRAFYGCKALKKISLTSTALTTIRTSAFQNCTAMTSFTAKSTKLKSIGKKAFYGDKKLATVTLKTSKLTKSNVKTNAFKGIKSTCTFKVPSKKVSAYKKIFKARGAGSKITVKKG